MQALELLRGRSHAAVEALFDPDLPTRPRAVAVLDGVLAGRAWTDDASRPGWAVVIETGDGTVYGGGDLSAATLAEVLGGIETRSGDLIFGFRGPADPMRALLPPDPYYVGGATDFAERVPPPDDEELAAWAPEGLVLADIDEGLLPRIEWSDDTIHSFGSPSGWTELGVGRALLADDRVVAQAQAGPRVRGLLEMGVVTHPDHRRRGYGAVLSRIVARACEARGDRVWWNTSADNVASAAIARRLGFSVERDYDLVAYRTDAFGRSAGADPSGELQSELIDR
jgi:RimJ/RimL family protein N-acetyltransferase